MSDRKSRADDTDRVILPEPDAHGAWLPPLGDSPDAQPEGDPRGGARDDEQIPQAQSPDDVDEWFGEPEG